MQKKELTKFGTSLLEDRYLLKGEAPQDMFKRVANAYADNKEHAQRLYGYMSSLWFMPATPVLANGGTERGLPISCFLNEVPDSMAGIAGTFHENTFLASGGGGIGTCWSNVRSINESIKDRGTSSGIIPFLKTQDSYTLAISQGCYDDETEILTEKGFIRFIDLKRYNHSLKVAQVAEDAGSFDFVNYTNFIEYKTSECLYSFKNAEAQTNLLVTGNHRMATQNIKKINGKKQWKKELRIVEADKLSCNRDVRFVNAVPKKDGNKHFLTPIERFLIAYQADGSTNPIGCSNGNVSGSKIYNFHFKKQRKINRLENILSEAGLYHTKLFGKDNDTTLCVRVPNAISATKNFNDWVNITNITQEWACSFIEELKHWDGSYKSENSIKYSTINSKNADITQIIGIIAGYKTKLLKQVRDITRQDLYSVYFVKNSRYTSAEKITPEKKHYNGFVYCVTVPTGLLIVRRCGAITICGNSLRRGSSAAYLDISHPEIEEFIDIRRPTGGDPNRRSLNLHHGVCISDEFMQALEPNKDWELKSPKDGSVKEVIKPRDLWIKILNARIETGEPYILYTGNVDKNRSKVYEANGLKCKTSNLCVAPETLILTSNGWQEIQNCEKQKTTIWNGFEWSDVIPVKTGENQQLLTIKTSDGQALDCTEYHKWYIQTQDKFGNTHQIICKRTHELEVGDKIIKYNFPTIEGGLELTYAYANGFYSGDGCQLKNGKSRIYLYNEKRKIEPRLMLPVNEKFPTYIQDAQNRKYIDLPIGMLEYKFFVPNADYSINSRLEWFAGLCDSDGTIARNGQNQSLQISSINKQFLTNIQKMLQEIGCKSKIQGLRKAGQYLMPKNDGTGANAYYNCQEVFRILIDSNELYKLVTLGLKFERLNYELHLPQRQASQFIQVAEIIKSGRTSDTYCFTEPKRNMAVFNGILTGNCSEITLATGLDYQDKQRTAVCCLSSLNLEYYDEWKGNELFIEDIYRFLDNVLEDFIKRAPDTMQNAKYSATMERSVGLGVMGFHSFLQSKNTPIEGVAAKSWNKQMFKHIRAESEKANLKLAEEKGSCPDAQRVGIKARFSNMLAIAPTASISIIAGTSPSIEPYAANCFTQKTLSGSFVVKNKYLEKLLTEKAMNNDKTWSSIALNEGSVQHLDFLTPEEKDVFKTAIEINQMWLIEHAANRQEFIDQAQSLNIFIPANISKKTLHDLHFLAWKKGVKSLYYCRSVSLQRSEKAPASVVEKPKQVVYDECLACQ